MSETKPIVILGVFVADTAYRAERQPRMGETILGNDFKLGPGGKGSNQSVAAARLGADVSFITRLGEDAFAELARKTWADAGVKPVATSDPDSYTGAAYIFIEEATGNNAIIISPGAAAKISVADVESNAALIRSASRLRHAAGAAAAGSGPGAGDRARGRRDDGAQPGAGRPSRGPHLHALRLSHAERERDGGADRPAGHLRSRRRGRPPTRCSGRAPARPSSRSASRARSTTRPSTSQLVPAVRAGRVVETTGRGRRLQRRLRHRARTRHGAACGGALRMRRRRHLGHPARHGAVHADARRGGGAARRHVTEARRDVSATASRRRPSPPIRAHRRRPASRDRRRRRRSRPARRNGRPGCARGAPPNDPGS